MVRQLACDRVPSGVTPPIQRAVLAPGDKEQRSAGALTDEAGRAGRQRSLRALPHRRCLLLRPAGCLGFIVRGFLTAPWKPPPRVSGKKKKPRQEERESLRAELSQSETARCTTTLDVVDHGVFGRAWGIPCPPCGAIPAAQIYPKGFLNELDIWAVGRKISVTQGLKIQGEGELTKTRKACQVKNRISNDATSPQRPRRRASLFFLTRAPDLNSREGHELQREAPHCFS